MAVGPLAGRRVLVTRAADRAAELVAALEARGAFAVLLPATRTLDPPDPAALEAAIGGLAGFDWLVATSAEGARRFLDRVRARGVGRPPALRLAAVGPATARVLEAFGPEVLVPERRDAEGLFAALAAAGDLAGRRVLFPRAEAAREVLARLLTEAGAEVVDVVAYRTVADDTGPVQAVRRALDERRIDAVTFFSPSAVRAVADLLGAAALDGSAAVATIGPTTSQAVRELGGRVDVEAPGADAEALVEALAGWFAGG